MGLASEAERLRGVLSGAGVAEPDSPAGGVDFVFSMNHYPKMYRNLSRKHPGALFALVLTEPSVTWPWNASHEIDGKYDVVFSTGPLSGANFRQYSWPMDSTNFGKPLDFESWKRRDETPLMVANNKFSAVSGELYSLRRGVIFSGEPLALAGSNWFESKTRLSAKAAAEIYLASRSPLLFSLSGLRGLYRRPGSKVKILGRVESKQETSEDFKFAFVIENSFELVTEKLWEALAFGNVPIYVGPNLAEDLVNPELVVSCQPSVGAILDGLEKARGMDHAHWLQLRNHWVETRLKLHSPQDAYEPVLAALKLVRSRKRSPLEN